MVVGQIVLLEIYEGFNFFFTKITDNAEWRLSIKVFLDVQVQIYVQLMLTLVRGFLNVCSNE